MTFSSLYEALLFIVSLLSYPLISLSLPYVLQDSFSNLVFEILMVLLIICLLKNIYICTLKPKCLIRLLSVRTQVCTYLQTVLSSEFSQSLSPPIVNIFPLTLALRYENDRCLGNSLDRYG